MYIFNLLPLESLVDISEIVKTEEVLLDNESQLKQLETFKTIYTTTMLQFFTM